MTFLDAILLGLVQGITEFFPVSSSTHLLWAKSLLHVTEEESLLYFDLACHLGTLVALILFLRRDIVMVLRSPLKQAAFVLALFPLIPAYFLLKPLRVMMNPHHVGVALMATASLLWVASRAAAKGFGGAQTWRAHVAIGVAQAMALVPGVSRSGSTMAIARLCGWSWLEAARFSFLLAVPTIVGGELLETAQLFSEGKTVSWLSMELYGVGFVASLGMGSLFVRYAFRLYERGSVLPFAWYCFVLGLLTFFFK